VTDTVGGLPGITIEVDVERLSRLMSQEVAVQLAALFPKDTAELWAALCTQAHREQQRIAAMVDITCPHKDQCPYKLDILAGIEAGGDMHEPSDGQTDDAAPASVDSPPRDEPDGVAGR
jgi:hypothetical protein